MLQVNVIRQDRELVKQRLAVKNFKQLELVDAVVDMDDERKRLQSDFDNTQAKLNTLLKRSVN
jgi:seryl-tRNA synthetase